MNKFIAKCKSLPIVDNEKDTGYRVGKLYLFNIAQGESYTFDDIGIKHYMDTDYFSKYFVRVFTDNDGNYTETLPNKLGEMK